VVAYFVGMLWLGGKIADRAYSLEPTAMTVSRVGRDGAFYGAVRTFGGGGSFGVLVVSVFKDYARRLENITNVSYILLVLIMMKVFIAPQYEVGPGDPPPSP
jgi:predicted MFS family arabinose efflux permease